MTSSFRPWFDKQLFRFVDVIDYKTRRIHTFESLQAMFHLPRESHYSYMQLCSYMHRSLSSTMASLPTAFERISKVGSSTRGLISSIYRILLNPTPDTPPRHSYMDRWAVCLNRTIPPKTWQMIWRRATKTSQCITYRESQIKLMMFWYHTPTLLHKLNPEISDLCWRCARDRGSQFHIFWDCSKIQPYWVMVNALIFEVLGIRFPLEPQLFLLNITEQPIPKYSMKLLLHLLTAARCLIALFWKRDSVPSLIDLLARVKAIRNLEYLTALCNNKTDQFLKVWTLWDHYSATQDG